MNRLKNIFPKKTVTELYDEDGNLPKLFRAYGNRQIFEVVIGLATLMMRGLGLIFLVGSLLDLYFFSYTFKVRNMKTGSTYLMDKPEWKKYHKIYKEQVQKTKNK